MKPRIWTFDLLTLQKTSIIQFIYHGILRDIAGYHGTCRKYSPLTTTGPLAQSAERGADNAKVVSSTLTRTMVWFYCLSIFIITIFFLHN